MKLDFNEGWKVHKLGEEEKAIRVNTPHDAMIVETRCKCLNGANSGYFPGGRYIYEKSFDDAPEQLEKYVALYFEGVYR